MARATIYGCQGIELTTEERAFYRDADPWGFILFARNIQDADQIRALCAQMRECVGRDAPVLIDQEGGRVARLKPPLAGARPPMALFGDLWRLDPKTAAHAARLNARLIAADLRALSITVDCLPVLDVPQPDAHEIIGDRALARHPDIIAALGRAVVEGLTSGGVAPVVKHVPGHGRALSDSHLDLPRVAARIEDLRAVDFAPFRALADAPMAMTAHVVYEALDADAPATTSPGVIRLIRDEIGFDGLLMTDDLSMKALTGNFGARARAAFAAGCDIALHCNGDLAEMQAVAGETPGLDGAAKGRADAAERVISAPEPFDRDAGEAEIAALLKPVMA